MIVINSSDLNLSFADINNIESVIVSDFVFRHGGKTIE